MACGYGACYGCAVEIGGELSGCASKDRCLRCCLTRSGCLDALTAPGGRAVARRLRDEDGHAAPARGQRAGADRRDRRRDAQRDRAREPGHASASSPRRCRGCRARRPLWVSVGGFCGQRVRRDLRAPRRPLRGRRDRAQPLAARTSTRRPSRRRDRRGLPRRDDEAALREALACARTSPRPPARSQAAGADGLSLVNTIHGLALDERTLRPVLDRAVGGLSGPALKPLALAAVYACCARDRACRSSAWAASRTGTRRARAARGGRQRRRARYRAVRRSRLARPRAGRARGGAGGTRLCRP